MTLIIKGQTPLHVAALKNDCNYLQTNPVTSEDLLTTFSGNTPLLWGVANSSMAFVLELLDSPDTTHVNLKSTIPEHLNTPLIMSISKGWTHVSTGDSRYYHDQKPQMLIAKKLLQRGAEVNEVDANGRTALHYACLHRNVEAIMALLTAGASWDITDKNGQTALDFCRLDYVSATKILTSATGGSKYYTFTLLEDNFNSNNDAFYQLIASLKEYNNAVEPKLLQQACVFNQKINVPLTTLYNHAKKIFLESMTGVTWEQYEQSIINEEPLDASHYKITNLTGSRKLESLLKIVHELKNATAASIDYANGKVIIPEREQIEEILNDALENADLKAERELITTGGMIILNATSVVCLAIPLLANYCITGELFFSHQTKTEKLIKHMRNELSMQTSTLGKS